MQSCSVVRLSGFSFVWEPDCSVPVCPVPVCPIARQSVGSIRHHAPIVVVSLISVALPYNARITGHRQGRPVLIDRTSSAVFRFIRLLTVNVLVILPILSFLHSFPFHSTSSVLRGLFSILGTGFCYKSVCFRRSLGMLLVARFRGFCRSTFG